MGNRVYCKTCNALIASSAKTCPSCGAKNKKPLSKKWWFWIIVFIITLAFYNTITSNTGSTQNSGNQKTEFELAFEKAQKIDYKVLYDDYQSNPISADTKYKDRYWEITGKVSDIDRAITGNPYVTFEIDYFKDIRMTFNKSEEGKIAQLQKGQAITIVGKCTGTLLSTTVAFDDCYIVQ